MHTKEASDLQGRARSMPSGLLWPLPGTSFCQRLSSPRCSPAHLSTFGLLYLNNLFSLKHAMSVAAALIRATALAQALHLQASMPALLQDLMSMAHMRFDNAPCSVSAR